MERERVEDRVLVSMQSSHCHKWHLREDGSVLPCPRVNLDLLMKTGRIYNNVLVSQ